MVTIVKEYDTWAQNGNATIAQDVKTTSYTPLYQLQATRSNKRVSYHHNPRVEKHHFGTSHPMKPWRLTLTNQLVHGYGLHAHMDVYETRAATEEEANEFHSEDYLHFLQQVTPDNRKGFNEAKFNFGDDCPVFDGMWQYCSLYAGASLDAARKVINDQADIAVNWSGGLHHAKKSEASGFCYLNDIVLAILQLLRYHPRVLYIDIDVHHGDGVEQAFFSTNRVMTLSIHKYDKEYFFPGTGSFDDIGGGLGKHHSLNVPLKDGIDDVSYFNLFKSIVEPVLNHYRPTAVVLQCGADSLACDRLGCFNLNIKAHGQCVEFVKSFGLPMLVLGGGGYTPRNVSRLWTYETGICIGADLHNDLPDNPYMSHFGPDYTLHPDLSGQGRYENKNTRKSLELATSRVLEQLRYLTGAPSVQMQEIPPDIGGLSEDVENRLTEEAEEQGVDRKVKEARIGQVGELMA